LHLRTWYAKTKALIVIGGLKGKLVAELCTEHQLSQAQYFQWREQCLAHAAKVFEVHRRDVDALAPLFGYLSPGCSSHRGSNQDSFRIMLHHEMLSLLAEKNPEQDSCR
jgi:hypothetical protein